MKRIAVVFISLFLLMPLSASTFKDVVNAWHDVETKADAAGPTVSLSDPSCEDFRKSIGKFSDVVYSYGESQEYNLVNVGDSSWSVFMNALKTQLVILENRKGPAAEQIKMIDHIMFSMTQLDNNQNSRIILSYQNLIVILLAIFTIVSCFIYVLACSLYKSKLREKESLRYTAEMITGMEKERARISSEIHDTVVQELTYYTKRISDVEKQFTAADTITPQLKSIEDGNRKCIEELRTICSDLVPPDLRRSNLIGELDSLCASVTKHSSLKCRFSWQKEVDTSSLSDFQKLGIYRIIQEAVGNAVRHAAPSEIVVSMRVDTAAGKLLTFITDDGKGFDTSAVMQPRTDGTGLGLHNMYERARIIGGTLTVESSPETGTCIRLDLPLRA